MSIMSCVKLDNAILDAMCHDPNRFKFVLLVASRVFADISGICVFCNRNKCETSGAVNTVYVNTWLLCVIMLSRTGYLLGSSQQLTEIESVF